MCSWGLSEWGDIANIVIAVASIATAIVTAIVLVKQYKSTQNEHQPSFNIGITENPIRTTIECNKGRFLNIKFVKATRYIRIFEQNESDKALYDFYCPIKYYGSVYINGHFDGIVVTIDMNIDSAYEYISLCNTIKTEIQEKSKNSRVYIIDRDIFHICYTDYNGNTKDYFIDMNKYISKREYKKLMNRTLKADIPIFDISKNQSNNIISTYYKYRKKTKIK